MSLPRPPRQSYKAFLWDYDSLAAYSDDECCYSLSEREVQILLAQLDTINWKTRYKPTSTEISQETIDKWQGNLARKLMSGCCPDDDALHRFSDQGVYQTSTDGGETWVDDPESDPRNSYVGAPPLPGADSEAKKCAAADNVRDLFTQYRDDLIDLLTAGSGLVAILAGILAFLAVITGVSGVGIGISVLLMGLATALLSETPASVAAQINATVLEEFKCLVFCRMEMSGQITYENWLLLLQDIANEFDGFPETFFYQTVNGMGYIGISNAGTIGAATAVDCGDCSCIDPCIDANSWIAGTVNSVTDNFNGTVTFNISSVNAGDGTQYAAWGNRTDPNSPCCVFVAQDLAAGSALGSAIQGCGSSTEIPDGLAPDECLHYFHLYKNFALTTPWTANITMGAGCT